MNGDNNVAPNDALDVINAINAGFGGEGEAQGPALAGQAPAPGDLLALLAADYAIQASRRKK